MTAPQFTTSREFTYALTMRRHVRRTDGPTVVLAKLGRDPQPRTLLGWNPEAA